jgi:DNA-directed RNA polymerase I and III subunit RPAC2
VEFCGYSIPHPSEAKMNLRIQTYGRSYKRDRPERSANNQVDGVSVYTVLEKGLEDLMNMCDVVEQKFTIARDDFVNKMEE